MSVCEEISSNCKKMPQIDPGNCRKVEFFILFDAKSVQFPRAFVINTNTIKIESTSLALRFLRRRVHRFFQKLASMQLMCNF